MRSPLTVALVFLIGLAAPESITVRSIIEDQTSGVVPNATVELSLNGGPQMWFAVTDNTGTFRFENISPGSYLVTIRHDGFETKTVHFNVGATSPELLRIVLQVSELHQEITVNSTVTQLDVGDTENQDKVELTDHLLHDLPLFNQKGLPVANSNSTLSSLARYVDRYRVQDFKQASEMIQRVAANLPEESSSRGFALQLSQLVQSERTANLDSQSRIATLVKPMIDTATRTAEQFKPVLRGRAMIWDHTKKQVEQAYELLPDRAARLGKGLHRDDF